jgi:phosphatidylserine decarboxylase
MANYYSTMTVRSAIARLTEWEGLNFILTNRVPRRSLTRFMGWFSKIEQPVVRNVSIATWKLFCDVDLTDAAKGEFRSLHDCFIRELKAGTRPLDPDPDILVSPCDAIVGACGRIRDGMLLQVKGFSYSLSELLQNADLAVAYHDGVYVTLRLTAGMYHRFHAPHDGCVERVIHVPGDTWNVNPPALKRIDRLYCKNERAILDVRLKQGGQRIALVTVAAVLVAGIKLGFAELPTMRSCGRPTELSCNAETVKGSQLGWFEHGSTIVMLAPRGFELCETAAEGRTLRMGQALMRLP